MIQIAQVRLFTRQWLTQNLPGHLYYHNLRHTLDVVESALAIATHEGVSDTDDLCLLEVAAWLHDTGFANCYTGHEDESCKLAGAWLPGWGASQQDIEAICDLIMVTRIPQRPQSHLQQILCDADLDYLGRPDFEAISNALYEEWLAVGFVQNKADFLHRQYNFISKQQYFTAFAQKHRQPVLEQFLRVNKVS
ncbi:MAG: phosphohydrolase [Chitinophagaceae bacterium]|nr:phosphohydrolase [Chitinophagaceae bacterium]